ncbi:MAG: phage holin family protein [Verrucomicrobiota bacterium]
MPVTFLSFLQRWVITTLAVLVAAWIVPGISYRDAGSLILASLVLGFLNAFVRPILLLLSLPFLILTLGLFVPVVNALLLLLVADLVTGFRVGGFWDAFWGGLVISITSMCVNALLGKGPKVQFKRGGSRRRGPGNGSDGPGGSGPIIDV